MLKLTGQQRSNCTLSCHKAHRCLCLVLSKHFIPPSTSTSFICALREHGLNRRMLTLASRRVGMSISVPTVKVSLYHTGSCRKQPAQHPWTAPNGALGKHLCNFLPTAGDHKDISHLTEKLFHTVEIISHTAYCNSSLNPLPC